MPYKDKEKQRASARKSYFKHREKRLMANSLYRKNHRLRHNEISRKSQMEQRKNPEVKKKRRDYDLRRYYGIGEKEYQQLFHSQDGECAICRKREKLYVDHVHNSNPIIIRGLLCHCCNFLIGHAQEDTNILQNAITYLTKSQS